MKKRFFLLTILSALLGIGQAWADWVGTPTNSENVWYVVDDADQRTIGGTSSSYYYLSGPGENLTFEANRDYTAIQNLRVNDGYSDIFDVYVGKRSGLSMKWVAYPETGTLKVNANTESLRFYGAPGATQNRFFRNVRVTMANHIRVVDGTYNGSTAATKEVSATAFGKSSEACHIDLRSFLIAGTKIKYTITEDENDEFLLGNGEKTQEFTVLSNCFAQDGIGKANCEVTNTEIGTPDNQEVDVYFTPASNKKGSSTATITIYDGETPRATVTLTAKVIPLCYFKATAAAVGTDDDANVEVKASFVNDVFEGKSATGSALAASADDVTASKTAYYFAPASVGDYSFKGWYDNAELTGEALSPANKFETTITSTSIAEGEPTETTLYAKYSLVREAHFYGDDDNYIQVDSVYNVVYTGTSQEVASDDPSADFWYEILNNTPSESLNTKGSAYPDAIITYDAVRHEVTARNAGIATIVFHQKAVESLDMEAVDKSYTFYIAKRTNTIYIDGTADSKTLTVAVDKELPVAIIADNKDAGCPQLVIEQAEIGKEYASLKEGIIYSGNKLGVATWTISQEEDYKYLASEATLVVKVKQTEEDMYLDLYYSDHTPYTGAEVTANSFGEVFWAAENLTHQVQYQAIKDGGTPALTMSQYIDGSGWSTKDAWKKKGSLSDKEYNTFEDNVDDGAMGVKFSDDGWFNHVTVKDVKVKRMTSLTVPDVTIDKNGSATTLTPEEEGVAVLVINYALANGGSLKIYCEDDRFSFTTDKKTNTISLGTTDYSKEELNVPVYFAGGAEGDHSTTVLIYNDVYRVEATITASVTKITPVITFENVALTYGEAPKAIEATVDQDVTILYEVTEGTDVVEYKDGKLKALKAGSAKVRAYTEGTTKFNASEKIVDVIVAKATPEIYNNPTADTIKLGQSLSASQLQGGDASVEGTFSWEDGSIEPTSVGLQKYNVVFTPTDTENYEQVVVEVDIYVEDKATGCEELQTGVKAVKVIRNGQVLILREGKIYNLSGQVVE